EEEGAGGKDGGGSGREARNRLASWPVTPPPPRPQRQPEYPAEQNRAAAAEHQLSTPRQGHDDTVSQSGHTGRFPRTPAVASEMTVAVGRQREPPESHQERSGPQITGPPPVRQSHDGGVLSVRPAGRPAARIRRLGE